MYSYDRIKTPERNVYIFDKNTRVKGLSNGRSWILIWEEIRPYWLSSIILFIYMSTIFTCFTSFETYSEIGRVRVKWSHLVFGDCIVTRQIPDVFVTTSQNMNITSQNYTTLVFTLRPLIPSDSRSSTQWIHVSREFEHHESLPLFYV